jgi:hypothetical protein
MSYFHCYIPNSGFIGVYSYKGHYTKTQETQDYCSSLWCSLPPKIIKSNDNSLLTNLLRVLFLVHCDRSHGGRTRSLIVALGLGKLIFALRV